MSQKRKSGLFSSSAQAFYKEGRQAQGYSFWDWVHGYVYGRWTYLYIGIGTGEHWAARVFGPVLRSLIRLQRTLLPECEPESKEQRSTFADTYHGKVVPLEKATQLVMVNEEISLPNLEKVIPYQLARDLILKNPDHIVALDCPCRVSRPNPCLPLDVCLIIGEPFASFVLEHHAQRARAVTQAEAVEILRAEDARGHVHHAFFKEAMLNRFYAICNCCSCCCGAMQAQRTGTPMLASSGYLAQVNELLCIGCGECAGFCQFGALRLENFQAAVDEEACMGCGICVSKCDQEALSLVRDPAKGEPLDLVCLTQEFFRESME